MPGKTTSSKPKQRKINVVDRRHHAVTEPVEGPSEKRSRYPSMVEELKTRAEKAEKRAREAVAAAEAELEAVRGRLQRNVDRRVSEGKSGLLASLLEVADSLDRAADVAAKESAAMSKGIELIRQQLQRILLNEGVEAIGVLGEPYNPHVAEAVGVVAVEADRDNLVVEELQRGYRYGETILRAARVKVGKATAG